MPRSIEEIKLELKELKIAYNKLSDEKNNILKSKRLQANEEFEKCKWADNQTFELNSVVDNYIDANLETRPPNEIINRRHFHIIVNETFTIYNTGTLYGDMESVKAFLKEHNCKLVLSGETKDILWAFKEITGEQYYEKT